MYHGASQNLVGHVSYTVGAKAKDSIYDQSENVLADQTMLADDW